MQVQIVGAGVIGLSIAWELSRRGADVSVIERGEIGRESSWAAAGILPAARADTAPDKVEFLRGLSHALYPRWANVLKESTGVDIGLRRCGGIYMASSVGEAASLLAGLQYERDLKLDVQRLTPEQFAVAEPSLAEWARSPRFLAAVLSHDEWQIRPPDLLAALTIACERNGVRIETQTSATVRIEDEMAWVEVDGVPRPAAEQLLVTAGPWTGQLAGRWNLASSTIPIRGQIMMYKFDAPPITHVINEGHRYFVPRDDGRVLIGSCEEEAGFAKATTEEMLEPLRLWAESLLPSLRGRVVEKQWCGLRPGTVDGFPIIGRAPGMKNLSIAAGHYRSGIHLAPITAVAVADLLFDAKNGIDLTPFGVGRFLKPE